MADFLAEVIGQEKTEEGIVVTVRVTGIGPSDGPLMTRAKARAVAAAGLGPKIAKFTKSIDIEGEFLNVSEDIVAIRDKELPIGPVNAVRDRLTAFRKEGIFAEVKSTKELKTERVIPQEILETAFSEVRRGAARTFEYEILVTTAFAFG